MIYPPDQRLCQRLGQSWGGVSRRHCFVIHWQNQRTNNDPHLCPVGSAHPGAPNFELAINPTACRPCWICLKRAVPPQRASASKVCRPHPGVHLLLCVGSTCPSPLLKILMLLIFARGAGEVGRKEASPLISRLAVAVSL